MSTCYILFSKILDTYYVGITTENVDDRIIKHNTSFYGAKYTSKATDWVFFYSISCECNSQMIKIEKHIKKMRSRIYIENLILYPEITQKLKDKFNCN